MHSLRTHNVFTSPVCLFTGLQCVIRAVHESMLSTWYWSHWPITTKLVHGRQHSRLMQKCSAMISPHRPVSPLSRPQRMSLWLNFFRSAPADCTHSSSFFYRSFIILTLKEAPSNQCYTNRKNPGAAYRHCCIYLRSYCTHQKHTQTHSQ